MLKYYYGNFYTSVIKNSYSNGGVICSNDNTASFAGATFWVSGSIIENCYCVSNNRNGFSAGEIPIVSCYFENRVPIQANAPNPSNGRTPLQMKTISTYENWDFENIWEMQEGEYPALKGIGNTERGYISISTPEELANVRNNLNLSYRLINDIDLSGTDWQPIGTNVAPFGGV